MKLMARKFICPHVRLRLLAVICIMLPLAGCEEEMIGLEKPLDQEVFAQEEALAEPADQVNPTPEPTPEPTWAPEPEPEITEEPPEEPEPEPETPANSISINLPEVIIDPNGDYGSPYDSAGNLSNERHGWYFNRNADHQPPGAQRNFDIRLFDGYYLGDINEKVVYLTFDEGYENGYTSQILDVLLEKDVKAAFFVTKPYIESQPDLILRMVNEGHIVGNHTVTHTNMTTQSDEDIVYEIEETARTYQNLTGYEMPRYFRPPAGEYSARTLAVTQSAGYKTIFWSSAYKDWDVNAQPGKTVAYETVMKDLHNGMIPLLHAVSQSNTEALGDIIDSMRGNGYTFLSLDDLP